MPAAGNLQAAANDCYDSMFVFWAVGQLKFRMTGFCALAAQSFSDALPNDRTVGNWLIPMQALAESMGAGVVPVTQFNAAAQYVYRICWQGDAMDTAGLITNAQATALLLAYNSFFS
jgi:hypothetical protein